MDEIKASLSSRRVNKPITKVLIWLSSEHKKRPPQFKVVLSVGAIFYQRFTLAYYLSLTQWAAFIVTRQGFEEGFDSINFLFWHLHTDLILTHVVDGFV